MLKDKVEFLFSFVKGKVVEEVISPLNGKLSVYLVNGNYILQAEHTNYSYGELHKAFRKIFRKIDITSEPVKECLLLGFGAGSVVSILLEELDMPCKIKAVEFDPAVLSLGKKYFNTGRFKSLNIVAKEAGDFVKNDQHQYDLIVFDIYIDDKIPAYFEQGEFLNHCKRLLNAGGILLYNKDLNAQEMQLNVSKLEQEFRNCFNDFERIKVVKNNCFYIYRKPLT